MPDLKLILIEERAAARIEKLDSGKIDVIEEYLNILI